MMASGGGEAYECNPLRHGFFVVGPCLHLGSNEQNLILMTCFA